MRLIDADALFKTFEEHGWYNNADRDEIAERLLLEQPTVDAVPVIRCRDCKHFLEDYWEVVNGVPLIAAHEICDFWGDGCKTKEEGWCCVAERRQDG